MIISEILHVFSVLLLYIFATACRCDGVKENTYFLEEEEMHFRQINPTGKTFKIGSWTWPGKGKFIGRENDVFSCERLPDDEYEEKFEFSVSDFYGKQYSEPHFIYIAKEVWSCTGNTRKDIAFLRIVNEVIIKEQISLLHFEDGMEVTTRNYESPEIFSVRVRETKYLIATEFEGGDHNRVFKKLAGSLILQEYDKASHSFPNTKEELYKASTVTSQDKLSYQSISKEGKTLRIGGSGLTEDKSSSGQETLICRLGADVSLYSSILLPSIEQADPEAKVFAKLKKKDFFEQFVVIKREIYLCTPKQPDGSRAILRVINDVIGTEPIKDLFYSRKIVSISSISLKGKRVTARFKEIKYLNIGDETWSEKFYNDELVIGEEYYHSTLTKDDNKDMKYLLSPMSVFRTFIANKGYELRIGETYTHQIGNKESSVECNRKNDGTYVDDFKTVVKVKLNNGVLHSLVPIQSDLIYKVLSQKVFLCTHKETVPTIKFLRIVNEIEFTVPVQEIDTYDGVDIVGERTKHVSEGLRIIEKKYLDYKTHKPVKYVGKISFVGDEAEEHIRQFPIISKTIDNATPMFGYTAEILPSLTDIKARSCLKTRSEGPEMELANGGIDLIFMEPDFDPKECDYLKKVNLGNDTALCEEVRYHHNAIIPNFLISDGNGGKEQVTADTLIQYFTTEELDIFRCTNQNKESKQRGEFLRVVTTKKLSRDKKVAKISKYLKGSIRLEMEEDNWELLYEDVRYLDVEKRSKLTPFSGFIVFPDKKPGALESGTQSIDLENEQFRQPIGNGRMQHKKNLYYTSHINEDGEIFELGSKWEEKFEAEKMTCRLWTGTEVRTAKVFNTRFVRRNKDLETKEILTLIKDLRQEVWDCIDTYKKENIMLRVVNRFKLKLEEMGKIQKIHYYDGLSIILGESDKKLYLEIIEVKYLKPASTDLNICRFIDHCEVVKYEGEVYLSGYDENWLTNKQSELRKPARRDFHHTLQENELRRTVLNSFGDILEIGQKFSGKVTNLLERLFCEEQISQQGDKALRPKVVIYKNNNQNYYLKAMDDVEFFRYFHLKTEVWSCKRPAEILYRVRNILKLKESKKEGFLNAISHVYYRDGITVIPGEEVTIEEIKYVSTRGADYKTIKFDGFVTLFHEKQGAVEKKDKLSLVNEMNNYFLDKDVLQVAGPYGCGLDDCEPSILMAGAIYEVCSPWEQELKVTDSVMICEEDLSASRQHFEMRVKAIKRNKNGNFWDEVHASPSIDYEGISQQVWICKRANGAPIFKVRYSMIVAKELVRIYYADGISVNWLELPDTNRYVKIVEDKLVCSVTKKVLKYDGELRFQAPSRLRIKQRFFPLDYKGQLLEPRSTDTNNFLSMDDVLILVKMAVDGPDQVDKEERTNILYMHLQKNGTRTLRVGTHGGEVYRPKKEPVCTLLRWNLDLHTKYIPKLVEYYDDRLYELDEEAFHFFFNIIQQNVWFCANHEDSTIFLRIVTKFKLLLKHETVGGIKVIALQGSVVPTLNVKSKVPDYFTETVFIDVRTDKHLKFAGIWKDIPIKGYDGYHDNSLKGKGRTFGSGKYPIKKIPPSL